MSERTSYDPGTPSWVELAGTPDIEASERFYRELFGWEMPEQPNSAELGGYRRATLNGKDVAGVSPKMQEGQPCEWSTYISVEDADAAVAKIREAGGTVIVEPLDVMGMGKMAIFADPTGAACGVWEPGTFAGAEIVNEDGTLGWNELNTRDISAAREFYGAVFGWTADEEQTGDRTYYMWKSGEDVRAGMLDPTGLAPDEAPNHWLVYFIVPDADAAVETAGANGGNVIAAPKDITVGRLAVVQDPQGAVFAILAPNEEMRAEAP
jgi:predicted enzyme related to lactoylglutathione lyase